MSTKSLDDYLTRVKVLSILQQIENRFTVMTVYKQHKKLLSWCTYTTATFALGNINNVA